VRLRLAVDILPYLTHLAGEFVRYRINQVAGMSSVYGIRLYELLLQWMTNGEREVEIEWLKKALQIEEAYNRVDNLKMRIINPAVAQINANTDLFVSYTQRKRGSAIKSFVFTFGRKQEAKLTAPKTRAPKAIPNRVSPAAQPPAFVSPKPTAKRTPEQCAKALQALDDARKATRGKIA
jgi:plasmid replication initiation protein